MKGTNREVSAPGRPANQPLIEEHLEQALALGTGDLLRTSLNVYMAHVSAELDRIQIGEQGTTLLNSLIDKPNGGFSSMKGSKRVLLTPLAQDIMFIIWRESEFVSDTACFEAGLCRQFQSSHEPITRNALNDLLCKGPPQLDPKPAAALKQSVDRICDALEVYGLIEREHIRQNFKPMKGTQRLHDLMTSAHLALSHVYAKQWQANESTSDGKTEPE